MMEKPTGLRTFHGKRQLSFIRGGDFMHPGEEKAILETLAPFPKEHQRLILDTGCGLGGTAKFIQDGGWGKVVGVDIEPESIEYARTTYPDIEFHAVDVIETGKFFPQRKFDLITLFSAFLVFPKQELALKNLRSVAHQGTRLIIFDYTDLLPPGKNVLVKTEPLLSVFLPIRVDSIAEMLQKSGWRLDSIKTMDHSFQEWYAQLLLRIKKLRQQFIQLNNAAEYNKILNRFSSFYEAFVAGALGGCILYATAV